MDTNLPMDYNPDVVKRVETRDRTREFMRQTEPSRIHDPQRPPEQPGKLRLLFAVATGAILAARLAHRYLPENFPPFILYAVFLGAPLAAILLAWAAHRGVFEAITGEERSRDSHR